MTNFTKDRSAKAATSAMTQPYFGGFGLAAAQIIYSGCMYALNSSGRPVNPGSPTAVVAGVSLEHYDNALGGNDAVKMNLHTGPFAFDLHATHPPTDADLFGPAFASDNHTISRLASDGSYAGTIVGWNNAKTLIYVWISPFACAKALSGLAPLTENGGVIGGANDGDLPNLTPTGTTVVAGTPATAGGATPSAAQVDTAINTAVAPIVTGHNALLADVAALRSAIREVANRANVIL